MKHNAFRTLALALALILTLFFAGCSAEPSVGGLGNASPTSEAKEEGPGILGKPEGSEATPEADPTPEVLSDPTPEPENTVQLIEYKGYKFSIQIPDGWTLATRADNTSEYFYIRVSCDADPEREFFYFSRIQPIAQSESGADQWASCGLSGVPFLEEYSAAGILNIWEACRTAQEDLQGTAIFPYIGSPSVAADTAFAEQTDYGYNVSAAADCTTASGRSGGVYLSSCIVPDITLFSGAPASIVLLATYGVISPADTFAMDLQTMNTCLNTLSTEEGINPSSDVTGYSDMDDIYIAPMELG